MQKEDMTVHVRIHQEGGLIPEYADEGCSGADVFAAVAEETVLLAGNRMLVPTGLRVEVPSGYEIQVRPRSGLALKHGITVLNTPGTIDSSYRGEIGIILINISRSPFSITPGMKIAQLVLAKVEKMQFVKVDNVSSLSVTKRGSDGFGSTGV